MVPCWPFASLVAFVQICKSADCERCHKHALGLRMPQSLSLLLVMRGECGFQLGSPIVGIHCGYLCVLNQKKQQFSVSQSFSLRVCLLLNIVEVYNVEK